MYAFNVDTMLMYVHVYIRIRTYNMYICTCVHTHRGTSNRMRRRRVGYSRRQKGCRKTKITTKDDVMMNKDHVI